MKDVIAKAYVNLSAIIHNAKIIKNECAPAKFCAVVKADAYGHGACRVADAIQDIADCFAVCSVEEGAVLRRFGIVKPIICLLPQYDFLRAHFYGLTLSISKSSDALAIFEFCKERNVQMGVHLALNTGMNRFGLDSNRQVAELLPLLKGGFLRLDGVYSHLFNPLNRFSNDLQLKRFKKLACGLENLGGDAIFHLSSGEGLAFKDRYKLDMVRVGLMVYGYNLTARKLNLKRAMTLKSDFFCERELSFGEHLLYGNYLMKGKKRVKIAPFGYFNGLYSGLNHQLNGCAMNVCAVDGKNCGVLMDDALKTCKKSGKICYEVLTLIGMNNPRVYYYGDGYENNSGKI